MICSISLVYIRHGLRYKGLLVCLVAAGDPSDRRDIVTNAQIGIMLHTPKVIFLHHPVRVRCYKALLGRY